MIEVEIPDGTIVEFPDEMSQDDIKSVLQKKFPPSQNLGQVLSAPQPELPPQTIPYTGIPESMAPMVDWERFQAGPTFAEERTTGVPSAAGLTPEVVPSGRAVSEVMQGIPATSLPFEPIRGILASEIPATLTSSVAKTGIGLAEYLSSMQGVTEFVGSMTPARLLVMAKWAVDMAKGAGQESGALSALLGKPNKTRDDWQAISDHAVNTAAMVFGAGATARGVARPVTRALTPAKVKAAQELSRLLETTEPMGTVQPRQPIRQLGIPQAALTAEPFLQPGIPELAGQALREAQSPLTVPGRTPAIEMLRQELAPPEVVPVETRLAGRIPERGGTMVTPTLEGVQVQPRVLRSASDILLERFVGREPMAAEPLPIPPEVQAAVPKETAPVAPTKAPPAKPSEAPKVEPPAKPEPTPPTQAERRNDLEIADDYARLGVPLEGSYALYLKEKQGESVYGIRSEAEWLKYYDQSIRLEALRKDIERLNKLFEVQAAGKKAAVEPVAPATLPEGVSPDLKYHATSNPDAILSSGEIQPASTAAMGPNFSVGYVWMEPKSDSIVFSYKGEVGSGTIHFDQWGRPITASNRPIKLSDPNVGIWYREQGTGKLVDVKPAFEAGKKTAVELIEAGKSKAPAAKPANPLADALRKFEDTGEIETVRDLVDEVDAMIGEGTAPESLQAAVKAFRQAVREDFEMAGRSDLEAAENAFLQAVRAKAGKTKAKPEAPTAKPTTAKVDVSSITKAKTEDEMLKATGELMRTAKTAEEIAQVQEAAKGWTAPPAEPPGAPREMRPSPYWLEDVTAPSVETVRAQRALEQRQAEAESAKTAISRGERVSEPTEWLVSHVAMGGMMYRPNQRVLHHGRGKAVADTEALKKLRNVSEVVEHDPKYVPNPQALGKQDFDQVVSNYVLNTLPPAVRRSAIIDIGSSMKPSIPGVDYAKKGGIAWITVRGGGDVIKGVASEDGVVTSKGTWQRNYTPDQLRAELKPYFKNVSIVKGNTKSSKSTTAIVSDYIGPAREVEVAASDLISKLESLKLPETGEGTSFSLPHPDAIKAIGVSTWNTAIDVAIASVKAGKAIAQAVDDAIAYLRKNVKGLDEAQARANLEYVAREETQPAVQIPSTEGETIKMRKSAERATTSSMVPEPVQERIAKAPESFYPQQVMKRVEEVVGDMTDQNLAAVPKDSNLYTASRLELARRLFERNDNEAGYRVFEDLEREGTRMGQLINQFKLLKGTRPENVVRVINEKLKREGKDVLNEKQRQEALEKATVSKQKDAVLDKATSDWQQNPTVENAAIAEKALLESHDAAVDLQRFVSRFSPRSTASILKSILQGNLLTPISETANIFGNISFLPFRGMTRTVATAFDILDNALTKTPREIMVQPIAGTGQAVKGLGVGVSQMPAILKRGTGDVIKGETRAGLHPLQAWINQFSSNPEMPTTGGKPTLQDRVNLAIEGTLGVPAEVMLRGLGVGDIAFKEAARARVTAEQLKLANVPRDQWSFAQKFPEFFLNEAAMERVQAETMAAVFQRSSRTLNVFTNWLKGKGEIADLLAAFVAPYKLTPWNIIGETLSYNPLVAFGRTLYELKQGNRRSAKLNAAKYVVGSMITGAGWWLYSKGLMSPSLDERDESQKARVAAGEVMPPNHINVSGLKRALEGGDPAFQKGDETVDVFRAGGLAGSMFYMTANIGRDFERRPEVPSSEIWLAILRQSTLEQARFGLNQSFLSGVEGLLTAIKEGNAENYVQKLANTVTSVPLPNSLTVLSRASREFKPDFHGDTFWKQMENVFRNKLGWAGMDDYLPLKRDLWGEPIPETPEGRNAIIYHFFDITKNRQVTSDPAKLELFRLRQIPSLCV